MVIPVRTMAICRWYLHYICDLVLVPSKPEEAKSEFRETVIYTTEPTYSRYLLNVNPLPPVIGKESGNLECKRRTRLLRGSLGKEIK